MSRLTLPLCLVLSSSGLAVGAAGPARAGETATPVSATSEAPPPDEAGAAVGPLDRSAGRYRFGPGDTLRIEVFGEANLTGVFPVSDAGELDYPLLGVLKVEGLTAAEVTALLHDRLKDGYLSNPRVMARPESYLSKPVQVLGAVPKPGMYYLRGETTLLELLALAGGVNRSGVGELRVTHSDSAVAVSVVSYEALIGRGEGNLTVAGGDVVFVPESHVTVMGQVQKPGDVAFREDLTVSAAIAAAGGALGTANLGRVYILRGDQRIRVDVRKALAGKVEDPEVQAGDRIVVRQSVF
jgi:polysaccharide export outer membrane protein